jgi:hypothetical protein
MVGRRMKSVPHGLQETNEVRLGCCNVSFRVSDPKCHLNQRQSDNAAQSFSRRQYVDLRLLRKEEGS